MTNYTDTLLEKIIEAKKEEISFSKYRENLPSLKSKALDSNSPLDFLKVFDPHAFQEELPPTRIIAEIKKASPSAGVLRPNYQPVKIAEEYFSLGAAALSVLTDGAYFQGSIEHLQAVRRVFKRPVLRKDFIIDPYQIYQSRVCGADCILAIVAILEKSQLEDWMGLAQELEMACLIEVHNERELQVALEVVDGREKPLLGINNRDLKTLKTDLAVTEQLMKQIPPSLTVIGESGIAHRKDVLRMLGAGVKGLLIGESLLKAPDLKKQFNELVGKE